MKRKTRLSVWWGSLCLLCLVLAACAATANKGDMLAAPVVTVSQSGEASWEAVPGAVEYAYIINAGREERTEACAVQLASGQSIRVKAVAGSGARDSAYSEPVLYSSVSHSGCAHVDSDGNGSCDSCSIQTVVLLDFYAINDLHGKFEDTDAQPGVDELTTYIRERYRDPAQHELLLSSGDMWQGTVESSSNRGALMTEWMNELDFVSMTLGNHEYDWGAETISSNAKLAEFPFLAINVTKDGKPVDYCRPSVTVERGGVKIGIIGAIGNCLSSVSGEYTAGLSFATGDRLTALVKAEAIRLRNEEGCDLVVYSIHDGYDSGTGSVQSMSAGGFRDGNGRIYYDTQLSNGYVDLVFEGHTHQSYILRDEYGVYHLQAGGENRGMSLASLTYDLVTGRYTAEATHVSHDAYGDSSIADDPLTDELFAKYFPESNPYTAVIGHNFTERYSALLCEQVAELYLQKGMEVWGNYDIAVGGGYLKARNPYSLNAGDVTYADLYSLFPFDNALVLGSISGEKLRLQFLETDHSAYYCAFAPGFTGEVEDGKTYYIVVDSYTSSYAPNGITEVARLEERIYARDLLKEFIASGGWSVRTGGVITVSEALAIGSALPDGGKTEEWYYIVGRITELVELTYGNLYLTDDTGSIYVYGLNSADGTVRYDALPDKPAVGDLITVYAPIQKYRSYNGSVIIELYHARLDDACLLEGEANAA